MCDIIYTYHSNIIYRVRLWEDMSETTEAVMRPLQSYTSAD